ncbi:MAG: DUF3014 domain-containing protein [Thermoanaerobaculales bacterium]
MADSNRTIVGIFVALLVVVVAVVAVWLWPGGGDDELTEPVVVEESPPEPTPTPTLAEQLSARLAGTTLKTSDTVVRELAAGLSSNPKLVSWLVNEDLIRRFAASVDNIAAGTSPRVHLGFLRPKEAFKVKKDGGNRVVIDSRSYRRYDLPAEVFASLDTEGTVALYRELKPLIDEAYREIAPPGRRFDDRLNAAFDELLAVPIVEGPVEVDERVVTYALSDERLENLSDAQRHLLRMGPDNVRRIQEKLREIRAALAAEPE